VFVIAKASVYESARPRRRAPVLLCCLVASRDVPPTSGGRAERAEPGGGIASLATTSWVGDGLDGGGRAPASAGGCFYASAEPFRATDGVSLNKTIGD